MNNAATTFAGRAIYCSLLYVGERGRQERSLLLMLQLLHQDSFINVAESARKLPKLIRRKFLRFVLFCAGRRRICNSDICGSVGDGARAPTTAQPASLPSLRRAAGRPRPTGPTRPPTGSSSRPQTRHKSDIYCCRKWRKIRRRATAATEHYVPAGTG